MAANVTRLDQLADPQAYRTFVRELLQDGMGMARHIQAEVIRADVTQPDAGQRDGKAPHQSLLDAVIALERASRGVRRLVLLVQWLNELSPVSRNGLLAEPWSVTRTRIIRAIERAIASEAAERRRQRLASAFEHLDAQYELEYADEFDLDEAGLRLEDVRDWPIPEVLADICRDFGAAGVRALHQGDASDIAALCVRAAAPRAGNIAAL